MEIPSPIAIALPSRMNNSRGSESEQQWSGVAHGDDVPALAQGEEGDQEFEVEVGGDQEIWMTEAPIQS